MNPHKFEGSGHSMTECYASPVAFQPQNYFNEELTPITVVSSQSPSLSSCLSSLDDDSDFVSIDLEWDPCALPPKKEIDLMQFATSKGALIVTVDSSSPQSTLSEFLFSKNFCGKGMETDRKKLKTLFGSQVSDSNRDSFFEHIDNFVDIDSKYLTPFNLSRNFDTVVKRYSGCRPQIKKDREVSRSSWSHRPLTEPQIRYAAYDAEAVRRVYMFLMNHPPSAPIPPRFELPSMCLFHIGGVTRHQSKSHRDLSNIRPPDCPTPDYVRISEFSPIPPELCKYQLKFLKTINAKDSTLSPEDFWMKEPNAPLRLFDKSVVAEHFSYLQLASDFLHIGKIHVSKQRFFTSVGAENHNTLFEAVTPLISEIPNREISSKEALMIVLRLIGDANVDIPMFFPHTDTGECNEVIAYDNIIGPRCMKCEKGFNNAAELADHCWCEHAEKLFRFIDERRFADLISPFIPEFCCQIFGYGQNGKCSMCGEQFKSYDDLASHWASRHCHQYLVDIDEHWMWPIKAHYFTQEIHDPRYLVDRVAEGKLMSAHILTRKSHHCSNCHVKYAPRGPLALHLFSFHAILIPDNITRSISSEKPIAEV